MRELDGLSHEEVASALDVSPAASRQLVKRARSGLVAAAEARDAECGEIRDALLLAHDEKRRPSEHALRHLKTCSACREFRDGLKATRAKLRVLVPPIGMGPLGRPARRRRGRRRRSPPRSPRAARRSSSPRAASPSGRRASTTS